VKIITFTPTIVYQQSDSCKIFAVIKVSCHKVMNVVRAATVGDVETVRQWLSAPQHKRSQHVGQVLCQAASMDMITFVS
jgi:hypothetical protein